MRETKFRSWNIEKKCWHYFNLPFDLFNYNWKGEEDKYEGWFQFIGLKDKNGKEIFEGDVIETDKGERGVVCIEDLEYVAFANNKDGWNLLVFGIYKKSEIKVIGNIHENSELLIN